MRHPLSVLTHHVDTSIYTAIVGHVAWLSMTLALPCAANFVFADTSCRHIPLHCNSRTWCIVTAVSLFPAMSGDLYTAIVGHVAWLSMTLALPCAASFVSADTSCRHIPLHSNSRTRFLVVDDAGLALCGILCQC